MTAIIHEPGIYFGMPAEEYHADPALGSTALKEIAADPFEWQYQRLCGKEKETTALLWGGALHARVLEGRIAFGARYATAPAKNVYPDLLDTMDDLRRHAASMGLKTGKSKAEAIANIREHDDKTPIWDEIVASHAELNRGKTILDQGIVAEIEQAATWMQADPRLAPVMNGGQIIEGASEVSIFYLEGNVRLRIRLDRLLPHAIIDLKSFRPPVGWSIAMPAVNRVLGRVIAQNRYDVQSASYIRGFRAARALWEAGRVHGATALDTELLRRAMNCDDMKWIWILVKNTGAPEPFVREFPLRLNAFKAGLIEIEDAIRTYQRLRDEFGDDAFWSPRHPADAFTDEDFPPWLGM